MNNSGKWAALGFLAAIALAGCGAPGNVVTEPDGRLEAGTAAPTTTASPPTSPEPSLTPTEAVLNLVVVEWAEWPYANAEDPSSTDTHVELLVLNSNDFPVRVDVHQAQLHLVNAVGEIVYSNPNPVFYIWGGSWMLPGETAALSACVCFETDGVEKQDWESLELVAPLEPATDIAYTFDVEVTLGEWFSLAEAHLGGSGFGAEITLTNTSDQVLEEFYVRVMARDASGKYVGVVVYGEFVADFQNAVLIQPGEGGSGVVVDTMIDYMNDPRELEYEINAIGILAD